MSQSAASGRRRFAALRALYTQKADDPAGGQTVDDAALALGWREAESQEILEALVARRLASRDEDTGCYRITSAGIRVMERTLFHRPHSIS